MDAKKTLYLIPNFLSPDSQANELPELALKVAVHLTAFVAESSKNLRAFYKKIGGVHPQNDLEILELNEHTRTIDKNDWVTLFQKHTHIGLISDAGYPCIADPGSTLVEWCHEQGISVIPLPGSSSFFMALAGSGLNGQSFTFHGYFPHDSLERKKWQKNVISSSISTHLIMETPYRNQSLADFIIQHFPANWRMAYCPTLNGTKPVQSKFIFQWKENPPVCLKEPAVFVIGKY